jgi:hypothetical protein
MTREAIVKELKSLASKWGDYHGVADREYAAVAPLQIAGIKQALESCSKELHEVIARIEK